jgi:hypothetical protein
MSLMACWKKTVQRKLTDYWPRKTKPLTQLKITYYWAVKKGPIPIRKKMQCRIAEVHAPQRVYGDKQRMVTASGWDCLRSHELYKEFLRGKPKIQEAPLGKHWQKCTEQGAPWCGHSGVRLGLEDLPHIPKGSGLLTAHRYRDQPTKHGYDRSMRYWVCWPAGEPAPHDDLVSMRLIAMLPTSFIDVPEEPAEPSAVATMDVSVL